MLLISMFLLSVFDSNNITLPLSFIKFILIFQMQKAAALLVSDCGSSAVGKSVLELLLLQETKCDALVNEGTWYLKRKIISTFAGMV